jgi:apolipoprotein N-acyltransferase
VAGSVVLTVLAHPPLELGLLACVMLVPVLLLVERESVRGAFVAFYLYSVAMALVIGRWLVYALVEEYGVPRAAAWGFTVLLVAAYALIPAGAAALYRAWRGRVAPAAAPLLFASLFVLGEWLRAEPLGLPWLLAAQPLAAHPLALQGADLGGTVAVGFWVVAVNAGIAVALSERRAAPLIAPLVVTLAALGYGGLRLAQVGTEASLRVGVVQASVPQAERFRPGSAARNVRRHVALTRTLVAEAHPDLVVWSETAVDEDLDGSPGLRGLLEGLVRETGVPLLTGAPRSRAGRHTNSVVLIAPGVGIAGSYAKQRLVPFSEYDPPWVGWLAPLLGPVTEGEPYEAGRDPTVFDAAPLRVATPVCFEITYPGEMRRFRAAGAELLVNLSNDAWFGRGGYARMHFAHAVFRAVELRTWVVRGANTGISGVVDPAGRVVASLPVFEQGTLVAAVGPPGPPPPYARLGDAPALAVLVAVAGACLVWPR